MDRRWREIAGRKRIERIVNESGGGEGVVKRVKWKGRG